MKTITWEVNYLSLPKVYHYCKKCSSNTEHRSSELFRVNMQKKSLDIWLIYQCSHCKNTWNLPIYSNINLKRISTDLLERFMNNDSTLAFQYASDINFLKQFGAEVSIPEYTVIGDLPDYNTEYNIVIMNPFLWKIKLEKVLRKKLALSRRELDKLVLNNGLQLENGEDILTCQLQTDMVLYFYGMTENKKDNL